MARAQWILILGIGLLACGGRYHRSSDDAASGAGAAPSGASAGAGAGKAAGMAVGGAGAAAASVGGGVSTGASVRGAFEPFPVATDERSPIEGPAWAEFEWSPESEQPALEICQEGWTQAEAQAAVEDELAGTSAARRVDANEFARLLEQADDWEETQDRVIHLFGLPHGDTAVVMVTFSKVATYYYYIRIAEDCSMDTLSTYFENHHQPSCDGFASFPLWGIPSLSEEWQACQLSNGMYTFEAEVSEDSCGLTTARFVGVLGFSQSWSSGGNLWFSELAEHPAGGVGYDLQIFDGHAQGGRGEQGECQMVFTEIELEAGASLSISDERDVCDEAGARVCNWKMHSTHIYGPL